MSGAYHGEEAKENGEEGRIVLERTYSVAKRPLHQVPEMERKQIAANVLDRYINGEQVAKIAPEYGVSDVTIYALLLREHEGAWKDVQIARAMARLEKGQDMLDELNEALIRNKIRNVETGEETPLDALSLARVREQIRIVESRVKSAQWELERLLSRLYGQKQEVGGAGAVSININLRSAAVHTQEKGSITIDAAHTGDSGESAQIT